MPYKNLYHPPIPQIKTKYLSSNHKGRGLCHCSEIMKDVEASTSLYCGHTPVKIQKEIERKETWVKQEHEILHAEDMQK